MLRECVPWKLSQAPCSYFIWLWMARAIVKIGNALTCLRRYSIEELLKFLWNYTRWLGQIFPQPESGSMLNFSTWHLGKHLQTRIPGGSVYQQGQDRTQALDGQAGVSLCPEGHISLLRTNVSFCWVSWQVYIAPHNSPWKYGLQNEEAHRCQLVIKFAFTPEINTQLLRVYYIPGYGGFFVCFVLFFFSWIFIGITLSPFWAFTAHSPLGCKLSTQPSLSVIRKYFEGKT